MTNPGGKVVPAHKPSPADPIAAGVAALFTLIAAFGLQLEEYMTANELAIALGALATLAASIRAAWQRQAAR